MGFYGCKGWSPIPTIIHFFSFLEYMLRLDFPLSSCTKTKYPPALCFKPTPPPAQRAPPGGLWLSLLLCFLFLLVDSHAIFPTKASVAKDYVAGLITRMHTIFF